MPLLRLDKVSLNFGTHVLLDQVDLQIDKGDRIGLLGRNGAGKTTLMKIIAGSVQPESGERWLRPATQLAWLEQALPEGDQQTVYDMVAGGLPEVGDLLSRYHRLIADFNHSEVNKLESLQNQLEAVQGWSLGQKVDTVISQLQLQPEKKLSELSGGWRKRVALARALVRDPDLLLLDEPTNHLDIVAIEWLEKQLRDYHGALVLVTHDRRFLESVANKIVEIDRGQLQEYEGSYPRFLRFRAEKLAAENNASRQFDKKLAEEEAWIRQGIKARRTRNEGRVRALETMRRERSERRELQGRAQFSASQGESSGRLVAELQNVNHRYGNQVIVRDFSISVMRGDRIGLVGVNGAGKTTLLKILLGQLQPDQGSVKLGTRLEVAYFDQLRQQLDPDRNLIDNVCGGQEFIDINGKRKHAISYLGDFLFTPDRIRTPARALSGGEQNRAILAKVFSKPANLLVLDEPTNDLDIETLELLEEILLQFEGTVLLVSHDRQFMDNVVTSILVFEGNGVISERVGGYSDWIAHGGSLARLEQSQEKAAKPVRRQPDEQKTAPVSDAVGKKRSYKEKRALEQQLQLIEELEYRQQSLQDTISEPDFYSQDKGVIEAMMKEIAETQSRLETAYARWEQLES